MATFSSGNFALKCLHSKNFSHEFDACRNKMRITLKKTVCTGIGTILFICAVQYINYRRHGELDCILPEAYHLRLNHLTEKVHKTLQLMQATHFLCHESLWAALYNDGPRSWDHSIDFCVVGFDISDHDEGFVNRMFKSQDLLLNYDMLDGVYQVRLLEKADAPIPKQLTNSSDVHAQLLLFQESWQSTGMMLRKSGMKRALLPEDCETELLECFPKNLIATPLPLIKFGNLMVPAPREGIEIQKYHYPNDWWLQRKIPPCW